MELLLSVTTLKSLLPLLAIISGLFVITTKNAIISVFNLIVLYVLVAFYLIYIGMTYIGISYIIIYIGAIAILFLFIIMMIDVEVVEKRSNNYLPLLFLLLGGFLIVLKKILYDIGLMKVKTLLFEEKIYEKSILINNIDFSYYYREYLPFDLENKNYIYLSLDENVKKEFNILSDNLGEKLKDNNNDSFTLYLSLSDSSKSLNSSVDLDLNKGNHYLLINPDWDLAINRITQISAIGDVLYTIYHSYIYILSVILLLGMIGAIILTGDNYHEVKIINVIRNKSSNVLFIFIYFLKIWYSFIFIIKFLLYKLNYIRYFLFDLYIYIVDKCKKNKCIHKNMWFFIKKIYTRYEYVLKKKGNQFESKIILNKSSNIPLFSQAINVNNIYSESITGNLIYFILANVIIALLLLGINSYLSLSMKYLDKGGGFECGFTSFVQTRERFNIIFYRVSLLFLIFDLEIILVFPYTVIYQKNQNIGKNNVIIFLYILIVGFIYELKEGALNIIKKHNLLK